MDTQHVDQILCPRCLTSLAATVDVCLQCGTETRVRRREHSPHRESSPRETPDAPAAPPLLDRPWVILSLLFLVMAILGLPLLWKSRAFGTTGKIILSIAVTLYTILLFWGVALILQMAISSVREALA